MGQSDKASQASIPIKSDGVRTASNCVMKSVYDIGGMPNINNPVALVLRPKKTQRRSLILNDAETIV